MRNLVHDKASSRQHRIDRAANGRMQSMDTEVPKTTTLYSTPVAPARMRLMGMPISVVTEDQAITFVFDSINADRGGWVITPNLDQLRLYRKRPEVRPMYEQADLILADGMPLIWATNRPLIP